MLDLEPIKKRLAAATPGPWKVRGIPSAHGGDGLAFFEVLEDSPLYSLVAKVAGPVQGLMEADRRGLRGRQERVVERAPRGSGIRVAVDPHKSAHDESTQGAQAPTPATRRTLLAQSR